MRFPSLPTRPWGLRKRLLARGTNEEATTPIPGPPQYSNPRPTRPWDLKLGIHQGRITKTALTPQAPQTGSSKGGDLPPPSPWRVPWTKPKNRAPGGHLPIMYLQINAESAAASTRKGRVQPGAPISGMPGRGSSSSKPAKQVPDPDASPARIPLHGRKTEARRGVCDGPQGPEKTPPPLPSEGKARGLLTLKWTGGPWS